jgi:hypothetical protein
MWVWYTPWGKSSVIKRFMLMAYPCYDTIQQRGNCHASECEWMIPGTHPSEDDEVRKDDGHVS